MDFSVILPALFTFSSDEAVGNAMLFDRQNSSSKVSESSGNTFFI